MFGNENNMLEIQEAIARQQSRTAFGTYFDLEQIVHHVQGLNLSSFPQQCRSLFTMDNDVPITSEDDIKQETSWRGSDYNENGKEPEIIEEDTEGSNISEEETDAGLLDVPIQAFLHILQYLDAKDICSLSATCRQCNSFCNDQLLWKSVLHKDMVKWSEVSSGTYPTSFTTQGHEGVDYKEVYLRCNPELQRDATFNLSSIPRLLWSFLPHRTPIVVMFGPGLETDTSTIVRKLITGHGSSIIKVNGVFPAMYPGVGTGFEVTINNKSRLRLVILYSASKKEREARGTNQPRMSKLIKRVSPAQDNSSAGDGNHGNGGEHGADGHDAAAANDVVKNVDEDFMNFEPNDHVKSMCHVVGGFIFVVDAAQHVQQGSCSSGRPELFAFMNPKWTPERKPLLVLSSVASPDIPRTPCVKVADHLSLQRLQRPWKVVDCDISSLNGLPEGVEWLVGEAQKL